MECQTCSKIFTTTDTLQVHVGLFQYLIRELLKCLAHAGVNEEEGTCTGSVSDGGDHDSDKELASDLEGEHNDMEVDDLQCPLQVCEQLKKFGTLKELQRHYATHFTCHEVCQSCDRVFERASTFLHHSCGKGRRNTSGSVRRRRKALRQKVDKALKIAMNLRHREKQMSGTGNLDIDCPPKRRKTSRDDLAEVQTDSADRLVDYTANGTSPDAALFLFRLTI
ncbi:hypothetical protein GQ44DRAFT_467871 [Phaeosphaeriaceae sp. PMI808]|nr:hypothetical protein GQ44DRAFT_467871 [Phaeosphaeriaceae sp. PMI808]